MDEQEPWSGILSATMFTLRSTYLTTLEATPIQLVFGRDAILPIFHQADWQYIKAKKLRYFLQERREPNIVKENTMDPLLYWQYITMDQSIKIQRRNYSDVVNLIPYYD